MASSASTQEVLHVVEVIKAIAEAIREAGPDGIPSGHLYAVVMGKMTLHAYQQIINKLKQLKLIRESAYVLYWNESSQKPVKQY